MSVAESLEGQRGWPRPPAAGVLRTGRQTRLRAFPVSVWPESRGPIPCWISSQHVITDHLYQARHHAELRLHTGILGYGPRTQLGSGDTTRLFLPRSPGRDLAGWEAEKQTTAGRVFSSIWRLPRSVRLPSGNLSSIPVPSYPSTWCSGTPEPQERLPCSAPRSVWHTPSIICPVGWCHSWPASNPAFPSAARPGPGCSNSSVPVPESL